MLTEVAGFSVKTLSCWETLVQKTGRVVAILTRRHSRTAAGTLRLLPDKNPNFALFSPTDSK